MRTQSVLTFVLAAAAGRVAAQEAPVTGELGDAPVVEGNPPGVVYEAVLPEEPWFKGVAIEGNVKGSIVATSAPNGVGVEFKVKFSNLPQDGGPFSYHIHSTPVPEDGNCTKALAHLDPYLRGQAIPCDADAPETCEVGDLSGKHGQVDYTDLYEATYVDPYSSLIEGQGAFFGNRSFVLHFKGNSTRISCANFELKAVGTPLPPHEDYPTGNCTTSQVPGVPKPTGYPVPLPEPTSSFIPVPHPSGEAPVPSDVPAPSGSVTPEPIPVPEAGAAVPMVSFTLLGAAALAAVFAM